jgi:hypothetical protein
MFVRFALSPPDISTFVHKILFFSRSNFLLFLGKFILQNNQAAPEPIVMKS